MQLCCGCSTKTSLYEQFPTDSTDSSLSVADFLVGLVIDPAWITIRCLIQPSEVAQTVLVKVMDMLWIHTTAATTFNLCCVSVDLFSAIGFPSRGRGGLEYKKGGGARRLA